LILIYPPATKLSEPPAGIARLTGALTQHGISVETVDMNFEGFCYLYDLDITAEDRWSKRALKNRPVNLELLSSYKGYSNQDRYKNAVNGINHILKIASKTSEARVSLTNYKSDRISPVNSIDLVSAANSYEKNPYFPYFKKRFEELSQKKGGLTTIGFSLNFLNQAICTFAMVGYLKKNYKNIKIILGGGLVTSWMRKHGWQNPFKNLVDVMIAGEGETQLLKLYGITPSKKNFFPDYSDLAKNNYLSPGLIIPFSTSGGCYWRKCKFCPEKAENNPFTPMPVQQALSHLRLIIEKHDPSMIHILDNAVSPVFLKKMGESNINTPWYAFTRVTRHLADQTFCKALKRSGCAMLKLGIESGDPHVLLKMGKGVELNLVSQVLINLHNAGIKTYVYLLFGTPSETKFSAGKTLDFTLYHIDQIDFLNLAIFNLPWFAEESSLLETRNFYEGDLSLYKEFEHPFGWNRNKIRAFLSKEFKKHPLISETIKRDPPSFSSNHAAFF
jgi:hypothetical protein